MLSQTLSRIDLLGIPIILNFSKAKKVRSSFGGTWTLVFLAFVIWAVYNSGHELFAKQKPQINEGVYYNRAVRPIELDTKTLPVAIAVMDDYGAYYDSSTCDFSYFVQLNDSSANYDYDYQELEPCTDAHFEGFDGVIDSDDLNSFYCLPMTPFNNVYAFYVSVDCYGASNLTEFFNKNPTVELYYPKYGLSLQNYTGPIQPYLYYYEIGIQNGTTVDYWSVNHLNITTDKGWLTTSNHLETYIQVGPEINPPVTYSGEDYGNAAAVIFQFGLSKEEIFYTRTYTKVQNVLADIGGLAGSVLAVLLIAITPFARVKLSEAFVNEMFELRTKEEPETPEEKQKSKKSKKSTKGTKNIKSANNYSFDAKTTRKENLQTLEMSGRNNKDPLEESSPIPFMKTHTPQIPGDESPLVQERRMVDLQPPQAKRTLAPQIVKNNFLEVGVEEISLPIQTSGQTIKPNTSNVKVESQLQNQFVGDQNKNIGVPKDLENPRISPEIPPMESLLKTERNEEEEHMRGKDSIQSQQDYGRNANQVGPEDNSKRLRKDGVFGTMQLALPSKPKKVKKPKIIDITFWEYLASFFYKSKPLQAKMKIINEGLDILDSRLDVFNLLKRLRDIDKMKGMIFDKEQLFLFDRLPRPDMGDRSNHWFQEDYLSYYEILKTSNDLEVLELKAQTQECKRIIQDKPKKSKIDDRILRLM